MSLLRMRKKAKWKNVAIDPKLVSGDGMEGFLGFKELTSYELVSDSVGKLLKSSNLVKSKKKQNISEEPNEPIDSTEDISETCQVTEIDSSLDMKAVELRDDLEEDGKVVSDTIKKNKRKKKKQKPKEPNDSKEDTSESCEKTEMDLPQDSETVELHDNVDGNVGGRIVSDTTKKQKRRKKKRKPKDKDPSDVKKDGSESCEKTEIDSSEDSKLVSGKRKLSEPIDIKQSLPKKKRKMKKKSTAAEEKTEGKEVPNPVQDMSAWDKLMVPAPVLTSLSEQGFASPMPIQALVLPHAIRDRLDIIGAAETGSGKTLAFGIPLINHILADREKKLQKNNNSDDEDADESEGSDKESDQEEEGSEMEYEGEDVEEVDSDADQNSDAEVDGSGEEEDIDIDQDSDSEVEDQDSVEEQDSDMGDQNSDAEDNEDLSGSDGGDYDLPPDEEDLAEVGDGDFGCVRVENDVDFGDIFESKPQKAKPVSVVKDKALKNKPLYALVLCPTRELAMQVKNHIAAAARNTDIKVVAIVGGMSMQRQERLLRKGPEIVVATPGRLWELIEQGSPHLAKVSDIHQLVIDEADRMVEKGHFAELTKLLEVINADEKKKEKRQTFVFSATLTMLHSGPNRPMKKKWKKMTTDVKLGSLMDQIGLTKPKVIDLTSEKSGSAGSAGVSGSLSEARISCLMTEKDLYLYYLLSQYPGRTLVFTNTKDCVRRLLSILTILETHPLALHADMHQKQRLKNLDRFKDNKNGLLLATDVAARGLDIPGVEHVIHYQVPKTAEAYVHRSGRTARAQQEGLSVVLVCAEEMKDYRKIMHTLKRSEDIDSFPTETEYMPALKARVALAQSIDKQQHQADKLTHQNNWFTKAAEDADIILDEETLLHDLGDSRQQADHRHKMAGMKSNLKSLLRQAIIPRNFSGKYPTKTGHFDMPYMKPATERAGAVNVFKKKKGHGQVSLLNSDPDSIQKKKNKKKYKRKK